MNTETEYGWDAFNRRIAALEFGYKLVPQLDQRIAALDTRLTRLNDSIDELCKFEDHTDERISALEATQLKSHEELKKLAEAVLETWLNGFSDRINALECKHKDLDVWTIHQFSRLEPRIAELENKAKIFFESLLNDAAEKRIAVVEKILNNILAGEHLFKAHNDQWIKDLEERIALSILHEDASHEKRIATLEERIAGLERAMGNVVYGVKIK